MRSILLIAFIIFAGIVSAQLSGIVLLTGQQNQSGIKVKFNAHGSTAVTDSTLTDAAGNYSINIAGGVYDVVMSKNGFLNCFYAESQTALLTNTVVPNTMTLIPGNQVLVSGNVSGNWTANNTYIVMGHLTVPASSTLFIQAGTEVRFFGSNSFNSVSGLGCIQAGSPGGAFVKFTSHRMQPARGDWNQFNLSGTCSTFERCIFEYGTWSLYSQQGAVNVTNSIFREFKSGAVYCGGGNPLISGNEIYSGGSNDGVFAVWVEGSSNGTVACNYIHDLSGGYNAYAIINNNSLIIDNHIDKISSLSEAQGIETRYQNSRIINNSISNCEIGIDLSGDWQVTSPRILNNTIFACDKGITKASGQHAVNPIISNNIITGNKYGISLAGSTSPTISSNLVWNNSSADYLVNVTGIGQTIGNNSQGHPIDSYMNMSQDPLFQNGIPPLLSSSSPCHNTGDPVYASHMGFKNPMGCAATVVGLSEFETKNSLKLYPVPCDNKLFIPCGPGIVRLYDVMGRLILTSTDRSGVLNVSELVDGCYLITVEAESGLRSGKVIVQH